MHVFVLDFLDTALINHDPKEAGVALLDFAKQAEDLPPGGCIELRWKKKQNRSQKGSLLYIIRYWVTPFGTRKVRLQAHIIRDNGSFGSRMIILERHNGRIIDR